jgi:hypothetical protein
MASVPVSAHSHLFLLPPPVHLAPPLLVLLQVLPLLRMHSVQLDMLAALMGLQLLVLLPSLLAALPEVDVRQSLASHKRGRVPFFEQCPESLHNLHT